MNHSNHSTEFGMGLVFTAKGQTEGPYSSEVILMISLAAGICSLVTVVGNTVVIISFFINKSLRNFSNYMILSLALSDLTIGAFSMNVFTTYNVNKKWILGPAMCKAWLSVDYTASNASVMNLLVICVDRYLAITKPVKYKRWCTPAHAALAIICVWLLSFLMWVPAITLWDVLSNNVSLSEGECYIPFINDSPALSVVTIVVAFYFPAFLMCMLYQRVIHQIKHRRRIRMRSYDSAQKRPSYRGSIPTSFRNPPSHRVETQCRENIQLELSDASSASTPSVKSHCSNSALPNEGKEKVNGSCQRKSTLNSFKLSIPRSEYRTLSFSTQTSPVDVKTKPTSGGIASPEQHKLLPTNSINRSRKNSRCNREHRVTVLLKFILLCFLLLWLPYSLTVIVAALCDGCVPAVAWNLCYWLCYLNSTVNPFCYGLCNENFRRTFKAIFTTRWWTNDSRKMLRVGKRPLPANPRVLKKT